MGNGQKNWEGEIENNNNKKHCYFLQSCPGWGANQHHFHFAQEGKGKVCTKARPCVPAFGLGDSAIPWWQRCQPSLETLRSSFLMTPSSSAANSPPLTPNVPTGPVKHSCTLPCWPKQPVCKTHYFSLKLYVYWQFVNKQPLCRLPAKARTEVKCELK